MEDVSTSLDFEQMIQCSLNSIFILEEDGKIVYSNNAFLELLNLSSLKDVLGKKVSAYLPSEYHSECSERLEKVFRQRKTAELTEQKFIRSDGTFVDIQGIAVPFHMGEQVLAQVVMQDITQRKAAEALMKDKEKLVSIGRIAAGIVHEVKNPLTAARGFLQLLKESVQESQPRMYIETIENELEKALSTMQNLLQVSKPDLHEEPFVPVYLSKELESLLFLFQDKLYDISIEKNIRDAEKAIMAQKNMLLKAFFNLIKNAVEAMDNKGTLRIGHYYENNMLHVTVSDTGAGVPEEKLSMLGTPFFSSKNDGTGLGLTQVYTTIHNHRGTVSIQSEVGIGTTFHIQLPSK